MYRHIDWIIDTAEFAVPAALRDDTVEQNGAVKTGRGAGWTAPLGDGSGYGSGL
jgi:hypothetical protein